MQLGYTSTVKWVTGENSELQSKKTEFWWWLLCCSVICCSHIVDFQMKCFDWWHTGLSRMTSEQVKQVYIVLWLVLLWFMHWMENMLTFSVIHLMSHKCCCFLVLKAAWQKIIPFSWISRVFFHFKSVPSHIHMTPCFFLTKISMSS